MNFNNERDTGVTGRDGSVVRGSSPSWMLTLVTQDQVSDLTVTTASVNATTAGEHHRISALVVPLVFPPDSTAESIVWFGFCYDKPISPTPSRTEHYLSLCDDKFQRKLRVSFLVRMTEPSSSSSSNPAAAVDVETSTRTTTTTTTEVPGAAAAAAAVAMTIPNGEAVTSSDSKEGLSSSAVGNNVLSVVEGPSSSSWTGPRNREKNKSEASPTSTQQSVPSNDVMNTVPLSEPSQTTTTATSTTTSTNGVAMNGTRGAVRAVPVIPTTMTATTTATATTTSSCGSPRDNDISTTTTVGGGTIVKPNAIDGATARTQSAPVVTVTTNVVPPAVCPSASDAGSIGSIPSCTLDGLAGGPASLNGMIDPQCHDGKQKPPLVKVVSATPSQMAAADAEACRQQQQSTSPKQDGVPPAPPGATATTASVTTFPDSTMQATSEQPPLLPPLPPQQQGPQPPQSQPQLLVAIPQQTQQAVYYQVPQVAGVVPMQAQDLQTQFPHQPSQTQQPQSQHHQQQHQQQPQTASNQQPIPLPQPHLPLHAGDQVIGMVGAIPILKIPGSGLHYVKKKKGRFNLLQESPTMQTVGLVGTAGTAVATTASLGSNSQGPSTTAVASATVAPIPDDVTVPTTSQSSLSGGSHVSTAVPAPQTFDGKSAPTVKKKGRFTVTNVKNPSSIPTPAKSSAATGTGATTEQGSHVPPPPSHMNQQSVQPPQHLQQQQQQQQQLPQYHQTTIISQQTYPQANVSQIPLQPVMLQPVTTMHATYENPSHPHPYSQAPYQQQQQPAPPPPQQSSVPYQNGNLQYAQPLMLPALDTQQQYIQNLPTVQQIGDSSTAHLLYTPQTQHMISQQQQQQYVPPSQDYPLQAPSLAQNQNIPLDSVSLPAHVPGPAVPVSLPQPQNGPTPPPTPGVPQLQNSQAQSELSPMHSHPTANPPLPNASVPKHPAPAVPGIQQAKTAPPKKKALPGRAGRVPQTVDSDGTLSTVGLGKVFYFLDQMKMEVTDADRCIKTLQTDIKHLRDKNKELEAKNRDLDRKLREEKALREESEARMAELRKKLREVKGEVAPTKQLDHVTISEEKDTTKTAEETGIAVTKNSQQHPLPSSGTTTPTKSKPNTTLGSPSGQSMASGFTTKAGTLQSNVNEASRDAISSFGTESGVKAGLSLTGSARNTSSFTDDGNSNLSRSSSSAAAQVVTPSKGNSAPTSMKGVVLPPPASQIGKASTANAKIIPSKPDSSQAPTPETTIANDSISHSMPLAAAEPDLTSRAPAQDSSPSKGKPNVPQTAAGNFETSIPPIRQPVNGNKPSNHRATQSLHDFDPLRSNANVAANANTVVPVLSLPTSYSFEAVTLKAAPTGAHMPLKELTGAFMSSNPFMVPVAFEMNPAPVGSAMMNSESHPPPVGTGEAFMANGGYQGLQQQQFMVVGPAQQQPIILQQVGQVGNGLSQVQENSGGHWPQSQAFSHHTVNGYPQSNFPGVPSQPQPQYPTPLQAQHPPLQQQHQQQQQATATNPFDPLSNR